ncbi:MAG: ATP-binding protein [Pseudomonadota bacterium]
MSDASAAIPQQASETQCDREQIHLIGSVQPHGALIAAHDPSMRISHASENSADFLGWAIEELLDRDLADLFETDNLARLLKDATVPGDRRLLRPQTVKLIASNGSVRELECIPHRHEGKVVLEFLPSSHDLGEAWEEEDLRRQIISDLVRPSDLAELAELSAQILRRVNGFDRVMIYRFADDGHGEVIAEDTDQSDSYLGLHYPASDIPAPARRHFTINVVRAITDIHAPAAVLKTRAAEAPLDLSYAVLRAVPATHLTYLTNMGVAASMSVSLVSNDRLWGLIACHHYAPRQVSPQTLRFAELLAGTISALLQGIENRSQLSRAIEAEKVAFAMEREGREGKPLARVVSEWAPEMQRLLDAQGLILRQGDEVHEFGQVPKPRPRYAPLRQNLTEGIVATDNLASAIALDPAQQALAAGVGYMELSEDGRDYLVLVRQTFEHVVNWAGKPETVEQQLADGSTQLNPRASFAIWREERLGRSKPFDPTDREALRILRRALLALNSIERERAAISAQKEAEAEEQRLRLALLDAARKTSMGELASALAHELNQPLAAVSNYVNACRQHLRNFDNSLPEEFDALMLDAVAEASRAANLVRRLRDFIAGGALHVELVDLHDAIRQGTDLAMLASGSDRPELHFDFDQGLPKIWMDPIQIGQVILNLAMNAITAMRGRSQRALTITTELKEDWVQISVRDTGPGIAPEMRETLFEPFHSSTTSGMGIGLSLCRSIVEAHGGRISAPESKAAGLVQFVLPIDRTG